MANVEAERTARAMTTNTAPTAEGGPFERPVGRLVPERAKPRIKPLRGGGWLCDGGCLGGTGWTPAKAYRTWLWNMAHNASERRLIEFGLTR